MRKGFTMVELLAVFTLMGAILIFSMPYITSLIKKNSNQSYEGFKNTIYLATESYVANNSNIKIQKGSSKTIYLKDVIESGYLKSDLKNPKNNRKVSDMPNARVLAIKDSSGVLSFELVEV